ncbi:outer membrane beta-barrel protein [Sphingobacterium faecium]|uniref:outer membrane beta-barrel protein n=1 Tax=Sphingobacterium faecium TaxID=34087 RepID=UPI003DA212A2
MRKFLFFSGLLLQVYFVTSVSAQQVKLQGRVVDSLRVGLAGASIRVYTGKDTLIAGTDKDGNFSLQSIPKGNLELNVSMMGYETYKQNLNDEGKEDHFILPAIILHSKTQRLQEVTVKTAAIRVAKDTIEYHAASYAVAEHDRLEDLLRQLPGISIDASGNVTAMGESMTKLRVNGKDFFTNNVKDFLKQLPAGIIAKLQVIDDYGDQANFTGIKVGKPQKMLNLVIKDGQSKGVFGALETSASTQKLFSTGLQDNLWLAEHQLSVNANHQNNRTEAGQQRNTNAGTNYRWSGDRLNIYVNYGYNTVNQTGDTESLSETVTSKGTLYNQLENSTDNTNQNQQMQLSLQSQRKKDFWNLQVSGQIGRGSAETHMLSKQTGVILQDLEKHTQSDSQNKSGNMELSWSRNMKKQGRNLSANWSATAQNNSEKNNIRDQLLFYNQTTGDPLKDSLNNRLLDINRGQSQFSINANYAEPLNNHATAHTKRSIDLVYQYSLSAEDQQQETFGVKESVVRRIDSLSNRYRTSYHTQQLNLGYRAASTKLQYNLGMSFQPLKMLADTGRQGESLNYQSMPVLPFASLRYMPSPAYTLQFNYTGSINPPSVNQLIPFRDVRNLQQVTIGNPDLKPSKNHQVNLDFTRITPEKGRTYSFSLNGGIQQDQVVSNVLLLSDTLGSWRQETHYLNVNGAYSLGSNFGMTLSFGRCFQFRSNTQVNANQSIVYVDTQELKNSNFSWSQNLALALNKRKINGATTINYYSTKSSYTGTSSLGNHISTLELSSNVRWTIFPQFVISADCNYRINSGYPIPIKNPVLINAYMELFLTKRKELSLQLQGYDLLDQQQSVNLLLGTNTITQRTTNRIGRYMLLTAKYNLSRFGGRQ